MMDNFTTGDRDLIAFVHTKGHLDVVADCFGDIDEASELVVIGGIQFEVISMNRRCEITRLLIF